MLVLDALFDIVGYRTARVLLPLLSAGCAKADDGMSEKQGGWLGCYRDEERRLVFTPSMASWIGIFIWLLVSVVVIAATGR